MTGLHVGVFGCLGVCARALVCVFECVCVCVCARARAHVCVYVGAQARSHVCVCARARMRIRRRAGSLSRQNSKLYVVRTGVKFPPHKYDPNASPNTISEQVEVDE